LSGTGAPKAVVSGVLRGGSGGVLMEGILSLVFSVFPL
jgi:hypothetical protein